MGRYFFFKCGKCVWKKSLMYIKHFYHICMALICATVFDNDTSGEGCSGLKRWYDTNEAVTRQPPAGVKK